MNQTHDFFFFNDTATTEIYTLSLHDALPISSPGGAKRLGPFQGRRHRFASKRLALRYRLSGALQSRPRCRELDRKSTRLNSSHGYISYAVFCLKKKDLTDRTYRSAEHTSGLH